ncbi:tellurite resistance protein permease [Modestobacter lapidis]|nr:tellurite resistance protein permease [Modestobacter lapidis]
MARTQEAVRSLAPGYFALVMASGILSVGTSLSGLPTLSAWLLAGCAGSFVVLTLLTCWRVVAHRDAVAQDFTDPRRGFGFFTTIAGANVLGVRLAMDGHHALTAVLLAASGLCWLVLGYVVPWTAVLGRERRPILAAANGTWFIWVVASQSVAVSAAALEPVYDPGRQLLAVVAVFCWSVGVFLYAAAGIFVGARMMLYEFGPEELTPPYWVAMGAGAITVVAGARIVEMADAPMVAATRGLIAGTSVVFWAFATWLIPVLVAAGWWRHLRHRVPLTYEAALWSVVFPLGMYAVAGISLGRADDLPLVESIGRVELWAALAAGTLTLGAMTWHLVDTVLLPRDRRAGPRRGSARRSAQH